MNFGEISIMSLVGKAGVELSNLNRETKEGMKWTLDVVSDEIKKDQVTKQMNSSVFGIPITDINSIKKAAKQFDITQVILYPFAVNNTIVPCIRVEGRDARVFFERIIGQNVEPSGKYVSEEDERNYIEEYGVIIYQKKSEKQLCVNNGDIIDC